jgi:hypothetical protein
VEFAKPLPSAGVPSGLSDGAQTPRFFADDLCSCGHKGIRHMQGGVTHSKCDVEACGCPSFARALRPLRKCTDCEKDGISMFLGPEVQGDLCSMCLRLRAEEAQANKPLSPDICRRAGCLRPAIRRGGYCRGHRRAESFVHPRRADAIADAIVRSGDLAEVAQ